MKKGLFFIAVVSLCGYAGVSWAAEVSVGENLKIDNGGIEFEDASVQYTATQVGPPGPEGPPGEIPAGIITMWSGAIGNIPSGWALCDGQNGTPNLQDRFILGAGNSYSLGAVGGSSTKNLSHTHTTGNHVLTINEMPAHNHANGAYHYLLRVTGSYTNSDTDSTSGEPDIKHAGAIASQGGGAAHNHGNTGSSGNTAQDIMPPYYVLAFIMKL